MTVCGSMCVCVGRGEGGIVGESDLSGRFGALINRYKGVGCSLDVGCCVADCVPGCRPGRCWWLCFAL